jgi:hypothetical protein
MLLYLILKIIVTPVNFLLAFLLPGFHIFPVQVLDALKYFFSVAYSWSWLFPVHTLFYILGLYIVVETAVFSFHFVIAFMRWFRLIR